MNRLRDRLAKSNRTKDQGGFSLIDVVVTVAIIVALSVGGFIAYTGLVDQAKQGAVDYAASTVYQGALVYENDSNPDTDACFAVDEYNNSSSGIEVQLLVPDPDDPTGKDVVAYYGSTHSAGGDSPTNTYTC